MKFSFINTQFREAEINPDKIALVDSVKKLTWSDFKIAVESFKEQLIEQKLDLTDKPIIIYGHKNAEMIVAIYALISLNITYIPIDEIYPDDRIKYIMELTEAEIILDASQKKHTIFEDKIHCTIYGFKLKITGENKTVKVNSKSTISDPVVYIIFTSGSTGKPKGVQITLEAINSFADWMCTDFNFTPNDVFINTAILSFDLSVFELITFAALGATLVLTTKEISSVPQHFAKHIKDNQGTVIVSTPSYILPFARIENFSEFDSVKTFLFCGEVLPHMTAANLNKNYPHARILNTYGPTEATVATTLVEINEDILNQYKSLPVGKCKPNTSLQIIANEIVIIGPNVSIGYFKNEELNQKKFQKINNQRAFFTGDVGYFENEQLFFNGRNDDLVKLNGYRIELNEINEVISSLPFVANSATIALKRDGIVKKIVSLVVCKNDSENFTVEMTKSEIAKSLPTYMIPSDIKFVENIPLNANGKADKMELTKLYLQQS